MLTICRIFRCKKSNFHEKSFQIFRISAILTTKTNWFHFLTWTIQFKFWDQSRELWAAGWKITLAPLWDATRPLDTHVIVRNLTPYGIYIVYITRIVSYRMDCVYRMYISHISHVSYRICSFLDGEEIADSDTFSIQAWMHAPQSESPAVTRGLPTADLWPPPSDDRRTVPVTVSSHCGTIVRQVSR